MRYIAQSWLQKGDAGACRDWLLRAVAEAPHLREGYVDLARLLYSQENWPGVLYFTGCALAIRERPRTYICEASAWGSLPHDLRAMAYYRTGRVAEALRETEAALALSPEDERLKGNAALFRRELESAG